jgi:hypothetical protein
MLLSPYAIGRTRANGRGQESYVPTTTELRRRWSRGHSHVRAAACVAGACVRQNVPRLSPVSCKNNRDVERLARAMSRMFAESVGGALREAE